MLTLRFRRALADERGSVIMAVISITVALFAVIAVGGAVQGGLSSARTDQNRTNAFQYANAGIDLALYRIDRGDFSGPNYQALADGFRDSITVGGSTFTVEAVQTTPGVNHTWTVRSTGTDPSGRRRLAIATISTPRLFDHGFFTVDDFYLTGNQGTPVAYRSSVCPTAAPSCELPFPVPGRLGTNAEVRGSTATTDAFLARWAGFDMYGRATQEAADLACDNGRCGTAPVVQAFSNQKPTEIPDQPADIEPCPSGGNVTGGTLTPGDYLCSSLQLDGTITVGAGGNGTGRVRIWVEGPFSASTSAVVNREQPTPKLQIFQQENPAGGYYNGSICGAEIWALLYTPGLMIHCNGSHQPTLYGAVIAQVHSGTGNHFDFHWDVDASDVTIEERFVVRDWRECPVGATDC